MQEPFISESCSLYYTQPHPDQLLELQKGSSLKINGLGNYLSCQNQTTHRYFLLQYTLPNHTGPFLTGICYNYSCNATDFQYMKSALNEYIPIPGNLTSVNQIDQVQAQLNSSQYIFLFVTVSYLLLCLLSTILDCYMAGKGNQTLLKVCSGFSFSKSFKMLTQRTNNNQRNQIMIGFRSIAFVFMVFYNTGQEFLKYSSLSRQTSTDNPLLPKQILINLSFYSFDVWFFVSGFTFAVGLSKNWLKHHSIKFGILTLVRRVIQVWIVSILMLLYIKIMLPLHGSGAMWYLAQKNIAEQCEYEISYFFLTSNLYPDTCNYFLWVWDAILQLSVFGLLIFAIKVSKLKFRLLIITILNLLLVGSAILLALLDTSQIDIESGKIQGWIFRLPLLKGIAYNTGFVVGLFYFSYRASKQKQRFLIYRIYQYQIVRGISMLMGLGCYILIFYYMKYLVYQISDDSSLSIMSVVLSCLVTIGTVLLIMPNLIGYNSPIKPFLKGHILDYISKLSFSAYSLSYIIIFSIFYNQSVTIEANLTKIIVFATTVLFLALCLGFLFCVSLEMVIYRFVQRLMRGEIRKFIEFE